MKPKSVRFRVSPFEVTMKRPVLSTTDVVSVPPDDPQVENGEPATAVSVVLEPDPEMRNTPTSLLILAVVR